MQRPLVSCAEVTTTALVTLQEVNAANPLGHGGVIAAAYGHLVTALWSAATDELSPQNFKATIGKVMPQFQGYAQHDVQV